MELHQLRYLVAIAHAGSFSRAAAQCRVAQPSLSQQIQKLEDELGEPLFQRSARGAVLTAAGEALLGRAEKILREVEDACAEARDAGKLLRGRVSVGAIPTIAPYFLPSILAAFSAEHPGVELEIHEDTTAQLLQKIAAMEIDLGIASLPLKGSEFEVRPLFSEELLLAVPSQHPLAKRKSVSLSNLEAERFILMKEGHCLGAQTLEVCHQVKLEPNVVLRSAQIETIHALVAAGFGISLIPAMACEARADKELVCRSLAAPAPQRVVALCYRKGAYLSRAALRLIDFFQSAAKARNKG